MVSIFCAHSLIPSKNVSMWRLNLDAHLTTYHSTIGVHIIVVLELDMPTLYKVMTNIVTWAILIQMYGVVALVKMHYY
jgi:hypothetical protein